MADDYTPTITTRSEGLLGRIGKWGAALITDEEMVEAVAAHDAEKRAEWEAEQAPDKDERLVRYMAMATPLGYQSALTVVQEMTKLLTAEDLARSQAEQGDTWEVEVRHSADDLCDPFNDFESCDRAKHRPYRRRPAGPWLPVPDTTNHESEG